MSGDLSSGSGSSKARGGRFSEEPDSLFERLNASLPFDRELAPWDIAGSKAHARMLEHIGVLSSDEGAAIQKGLDRIAEEVDSDVFVWDLADEDVHMAIERRLTDLIGPVGGKLHTGRSRNDQVALDLHLYLRDATRGHVRKVVECIEALLRQVQSHQGTILPGYTHLQRAQPVSLSHHLLAYVFMLIRDGERLRRWTESSWMPLGAGALAGANYPLDREMVAAELGFLKVAPNAMDAVAARDAAFEYLAIAAGCALTLSRLAEEIILWTSQEFGFARLPDTWSTGSSIMPQKRNPDGAELVRAKAAGFLGRLVSLGSLLKGLPLAYNKDLQEDKLYVFASREELDLCLEASASMVTSLEVDPLRMRAAAEQGYLQATDVADLLVAKGLPFRDAHRIVGTLVARAAAAGITLAEVDMSELRELCPLFDEEYFLVVDLDRAVAGKVSPGGTAPARVKEQIAQAQAMTDRLRASSADDGWSRSAPG